MDADFDLVTLLKYGHSVAREAEALIEGEGADIQYYTIVYIAKETDLIRIPKIKSILLLISFTFLTRGVL